MKQEATIRQLQRFGKESLLEMKSLLLVFSGEVPNLLKDWRNKVLARHSEGKQHGNPQVSLKYLKEYS